MAQEPTTDLLHGESPLRVTKRLLLATRPAFFPVSVLPILAGTSSGYRTGGHFDIAAFLFALLGFVFVHAAGNVMNDVQDDLSGTDQNNAGRIYPYTGGSRFIQNGIMSRRQMMYWGVGLFCLSGAFGFGLVAVSGPGILVFGIAGVSLFLLYLAPPLQLGTKGFAELGVGLGFGVLPVTAAAWLQAGEVTGQALLLSIPIALWVANVLLVNEVPDRKADADAGKNTLVVILGCRAAKWLYLLLNLLAFVATVALAVETGMPMAMLVGPAVLCLAAIPAATAVGPDPGPRPALRRAIRITIAIHALGSVWLMAWILCCLAEQGSDA